MRLLKFALYLPGWLLVSLVLLSGACRPQTTGVLSGPSTQAVSSPTAQPTLTITSTQPASGSPTTVGLAEAATATVTPMLTRLSALTPILAPPSATASITPVTPFAPTITPTPTATNGNPAYPGPNQSDGILAYPGPGPVQMTEAYPGDAGGIFNPGGQVNPTLANTATRPAGAQILAPTVTPSPLPLQQLTPTPTRLPTIANGTGFMPREIPPGNGNPTLVIWHAWDNTQVSVLEEIVRVYQATYPQVSIILTYVPQGELLQSYESALYLGSAPDLVLGSSDWGAGLYDQAMAADLSSYFGQDFWQAISAPALATGQYRQSQVSLPYTMHGVVMYRNRKIITMAPASVDAMLQSARQATKGGIVGAYLELSAYYSMAHLQGLGGAWLDDAGHPIFDHQGFAQALSWMDLLKAFSRAGAVEVNTSRDVSLFQQGKVGIIIDSTWNMTALAQAVGLENLAVDPWPVYGSGRLAGFVQAQSLYLNPVTASRQDARLAAALQFMAAMLSPQVQRRLAEMGSIPVLKTVQPTDPLARQAQLALQSGVAFPPALQGEIRLAYWTAVDAAIRQALALDQAQPKSPLEALKAAFEAITSRLPR